MCLVFHFSDIGELNIFSAFIFDHNLNFIQVLNTFDRSHFESAYKSPPAVIGWLNMLIVHKQISIYIYIVIYY